MVIDQTQRYSKTEKIWAKINEISLCWHLKPLPYPGYVDSEMEMDVWWLSRLPWKQKCFMLILAPDSSLMYWTHVPSEHLQPHFHFK